MSTEEEKDRSWRIVVFSGKEEDWRKWSRKFSAYAIHKGFKDLLEGTELYPVARNELRLTEEEEDSRSKFRKLNQTAYGSLLYAVEDEISFNAVDTAVTTIFPEGCARTAWKKLKARWEPSTMTTVYELESKFAKSKLTDSNKNPEEWITELEHIRNRIVSLNAPFSEGRLIGHILTNLPQEYDSTVESIQREIIVRGSVPPSKQY